MMDSFSKAGCLKVALVTSCLVPRDAISNCCRQQIDAVTRWGRQRRIRTDIKLYSHAAEIPDSRICVVDHPGSLVVDAHFAACDLLLYHFGIYYPLFDSIHGAPRSARVVATYHGITPPALVPPESQGVLHESFRQAANLFLADRVLVTSQFLGRDLIAMGLPANRVHPLPLPSSLAAKPALHHDLSPSEVLRLLYVGRFVSAKGVLDLLQAFRIYLEQTGLHARLDLIGSARFSDQAFVQRLHAFVSDHHLGQAVRFRFDLPDAELAAAYTEADALVVPSYHEGYCVPVIEAFACGCFVICSDAGALPETSAGLGRTFAVGNIAALAERLRELSAARQRGGYSTDEGFLSRADWLIRASTASAGVSLACWRQRFCAAALDGLTPMAEENRQALVERRRGLLAGLHAGVAGPCEPYAPWKRVRETLGLSRAA